MNTRQRIAITTGIVLVVLMSLFPPWIFIYHGQGYRPRTERFAGYHAIWQGNTPTDADALKQIFNVPAHPSFFSIKIDTSRLYIQIVAVLLVTALLAILLRPNAKT